MFALVLGGIEVASVINLLEASGRVAAGLFMTRGNWVLPTGHEGHLPRREVSLLAGGQPSEGF